MFFRRLIITLGLIVAGSAAAAPELPPAPTPDRPDLVLVVVESLERTRGAISYFDRLDLALHRVVSERKWPVNFLAERFAANSVDHPIELRVYNQTIREDLPGERQFRAWMTFTMRGKKHDFGVVTFSYNPRPGEAYEDMVDAIFRGAANLAADKLAPLLFPQPPAPPSS